MRTYTIDPVAASIHVISDTVVNTQLPNNGNKPLIRNITNDAVLDFLPIIMGSFHAKDAPYYPNASADNTSAAEIADLNKNKQINFLADSVIILNFTNSNIYVKGRSDFPELIPPLTIKKGSETVGIRTTKRDMIYVLHAHTVYNSNMPHTVGGMDYIRQLDYLYKNRKATSSGAVCKESEVIVEYLLKHQRELTNFNSVVLEGAAESEKHYFIRALAAYPIPIEYLTRQPDKTIVLANNNMMLSTKGFIEMPEHGASIYSSYLYQDRLNNPTADEYVNKLGKTIVYYNDISNNFESLYYNSFGKIKKLVNIKSPHREECVYIEGIDPVDNAISLYKISFDDIKDKTSLYIFNNTADAEKALDPTKTIEALKVKYEAEKEKYRGENLKTEKVVKEIDMVAQISKSGVDMDAYRMKSVVDTSKSEYDLAKYKRETAQENSKNMWVAVGATTAVVSLASAVLHGMFGKK